MFLFLLPFYFLVTIISDETLIMTTFKHADLFKLLVKQVVAALCFNRLRAKYVKWTNPTLIWTSLLLVLGSG